MNIVIRHCVFFRYTIMNYLEVRMKSDIQMLFAEYVLNCQMHEENVMDANYHSTTICLHIDIP